MRYYDEYGLNVEAKLFEAIKEGGLRAQPAFSLLHVIG